MKRTGERGMRGEEEERGEKERGAKVRRCGRERDKGEKRECDSGHCQISISYPFHIKHRIVFGVWEQWGRGNEYGAESSR